MIRQGPSNVWTPTEHNKLKRTHGKYKRNMLHREYNEMALEL